MTITTKNNKIIGKSSLIYFISRAIILVMFIFMALFSEKGILDILNIYDEQHYLNIAMYGYQEAREYAFFPLIPCIIKVFLLFMNRTGAAICFITLGAVIGYINIFFIHKLGKLLEYDDGTIMTIEVLYILSPILIWNSLVYTETIQIFLILMSFCILYKDKKKLSDYIVLGVCIGLNVCAKSTGAIFFFAIFFKMFYDFIKHKEKFINGVITYSIATILSLLYPIYLFITGVGAFKFLDVQYTEWYKVKCFPFHVFVEDIKFLSTTSQDGYRLFANVLIFVINWFVIFLFLSFVIRAIVKKDKNIWIVIACIMFMLVVLGNMQINICNLPSFSFYRYFLSNILFLFLIDVKNKTIRNIIIIAFGYLSFIIAIFTLLKLPIC